MQAKSESINILTSHSFLVYCHLTYLQINFNLTVNKRVDGVVGIIDQFINELFARLFPLCINVSAVPQFLVKTGTILT